MLLNELFNQPATLKTIQAHDGEFIQRATLSDGTVIDIMYDYMGLLPNAMSNWKLMFKRKTVQQGIGNKFRSMVGMEPKLSAGSFGKTGEGNEVEVFATVKHSVEQFVKSHDPGQIVFTADKGNQGEDGSRASLYGAMVRRWLPKNMYDVTVKPEAQFDQFIISKKAEFAPKQINQKDTQDATV